MQRTGTLDLPCPVRDSRALPLLPTTFRAVKGMNDILPPEIEPWHVLERAFVRSAELYGYQEIRTPLVEPTGLFVRSIGEVTDVVQKEMYTFAHHDESLTLRPEATASCVRAYVQHSVASRDPITRWYYLGPMYRAERPQRGRYRQFFQAGCEVFGDPGPACDAEMIAMLTDLYTGLGIPNLRVMVNSLGGTESRERYRQALLDFLRPLAPGLSAESQSRLERNPLRVLDSKNPKDQELVQGAPRTIDALVESDRQHFDELTGQLTGLGVAFEINPRLVRGLDYYTRTLFEIQSDAGELGAQNTLAGGGRYDGLVRSLGGPDVPAIGFAMGLERVLLAMGKPAQTTAPAVFVAPLGTEPVRQGLAIARELRMAGIRTEIDGRDNSLKSKLRRANTSGAQLAIVIGQAEWEAGRVQLKNLAQHTQSEVPRAELLARVQEELQRPPDANPGGTL